MSGSDDKKDDGVKVPETLKSFTEHLKERVFSPLSAAFVVSWLIANHLYVVILLSNDDVPRKIEMLSKYVSSGFWDGLVTHLLIPLSGALFYVYGYTWFSSRVFDFWYRSRVKLANRKKEIDCGRVLSEAESRAMEVALGEANGRVEELTSQCEGVKTANSNLRLELMKSREEAKRKDEGLEDLKKKVSLQLLRVALPRIVTEPVWTRERLVRDFEVDPDLADLLLNELLSRGVFHRKRGTLNGVEYDLATGVSVESILASL